MITSVQVFNDRERDAVIAQGSMGNMFAAYTAHAAQWNILPDEPAQTMMRHTLAAATLHLSLLPRDEFTAWTLNIKEPPLNFFVSGDNNQFIVTGRAYTSDVQTSSSSRLFMESQRPKREPTRSVLDVTGLGVHEIFEEFYSRSEQIPNRLFEIAESEFVLVRGLPQVDLDWLASLNETVMKARLGEPLELIEERDYRFNCGCNPQIILKVMRGMYADKAEELFLGEAHVEVLCPRCGRHWWVTREDFDAGPEKLGVC